MIKDYSTVSRKTDIKNTRMSLGKFLHEYYIKYGEEKYESFMSELGPSMESEYGEAFSGDNLRIMEAEFVMLSAPIKKRRVNAQNKKNIDV